MLARYLRFENLPEGPGCPNAGPLLLKVYLNDDNCALTLITTSRRSLGEEVMRTVDFVPLYYGFQGRASDDEGSTTVPCGVISLADSLDRRIQMMARGVPSDWIENFFEGTDLRASSADELAKLADVHVLERRYGRAPTSGEIGCAISHRQLFLSFLKSGASLALAFEDDILPSENFYPKLKRIASDLLWIAESNKSFICNIGLPDGFLYTHRVRPVHLVCGSKRWTTSFLSVCAKDPIWRANAYFISRVAAENILSSERRIDRLADDWTSRRLEGSLDHIFVSEPAIALQDDAVQSTLEAERRSRRADSVHYREGTLSRSWQMALRMRSRVERLKICKIHLE